MVELSHGIPKVHIVTQQNLQNRVNTQLLALKDLFTLTTPCLQVYQPRLCLLQSNEGSSTKPQGSWYKLIVISRRWHRMVLESRRSQIPNDIRNQSIHGTRTNNKLQEVDANSNVKPNLSRNSMGFEENGGITNLIKIRNHLSFNRKSDANK
ncbi:MAG: hypothetical protein EZS28_035917 [Streblomastix strix]|uniref:Uncharacterized protein n=1 Tax=Streblomastix strix TaxID=222440 RepID=A0A5J4UDQ2_9EUKA|nr:MAG: hypothetical protein EZS28_035917 [Streblomastix strix]